ncbi:MAG: ABC transporter permease subunit [Bacteroidales bacterium]|nr:ABC transporter permease subunit [Bacteroidales bacterium]
MKRLVYFIVSTLLLVSCGNKTQTIELNIPDDLAGHSVATIACCAYEKDISSRTDINCQLYNSSSDLLQALLSGQTEIVMYDEAVYNAIIRKEYDIKIAMLGDQSFPTAFLFRKDDSELVRTFNAVQRRMIEDGTMQKLIDFWLTDKFAEAESYTHIPAETSGEPLRVATVLPTAPISFMVDGEWYGIEIDMIRELAKELHRPLEIKLYDNASGFMAVQSGQADILCGIVFVTPERQEKFLFSEPYHSYHTAYFVLDHDAESQDHGFIAGIKKGINKTLFVENRWRLIVDGLLKTLKISIVAILLGSLLGVGLYSMANSRRKWLRSCAKVYRSFISGIPELVLLLVMFYVVFANTGVSPDIVAIITFALFFASGASHIYKASLDAIPCGQTEAGLALGFTKSQSFFNIVLPQAFRIGLPLYKGQCISLLKGTSIVGYIAIQDITRAGDIIRSRTFDAIVPLLFVTILYFLLVWLIGALIKLASPKKNVL